MERSRSGRWGRDRSRPEEDQRDSRSTTQPPRNNSNNRHGYTDSNNAPRSPANEPIGFGSHTQGSSSSSSYHPQQQQQYPPQQQHQQQQYQQQPHHELQQPGSGMGSRINSGSSTTSYQTLLPPPPPPCFPTPDSTPEELEGYRLWFDKYSVLYQQYQQHMAEQQQQQQLQYSALEGSGGHHQQPVSDRRYEDQGRHNAPLQQQALRHHQDPSAASSQPESKEEMERRARARQDAGRVAKTHEQYTMEVKQAESKTLRLYCPVTPTTYEEQYDRYIPNEYHPQRNHKDAMEALEGRLPTHQTGVPQTKAQIAEERYRNYAGTFPPNFVHNALYRCHSLEYQDGDHVARKRYEEDIAVARRSKGMAAEQTADSEAEILSPRELVDDPVHDVVAQFHGRYRTGPSHEEMYEAERQMNLRRGQPTQPFQSAAVSRDNFDQEQESNLVVIDGLIDKWRDITAREAALPITCLQMKTRNATGIAGAVSDESNRHTCAPRVEGIPPAYHHASGDTKRALSWETIPMNPLIGVSGHDAACLMRIQNRVPGASYDNFRDDEREDNLTSHPHRRGGRRQEGGGSNSNNKSSKTNNNHHQQGGVRRGGEPSYAHSDASPPPFYVDSRCPSENRNTNNNQLQQIEYHPQQQQQQQQPSHFDLMPTDSFAPRAPQPPQPPVAKKVFSPTATAPSTYKPPHSSVAAAQNPQQQQQHTTSSTPSSTAPPPQQQHHSTNKVTTNSFSSSWSKPGPQVRSSTTAPTTTTTVRGVAPSVAAAVRAAFEAKSQQGGGPPGAAPSSPTSRVAATPAPQPSSAATLPYQNNHQPMPDVRYPNTTSTSSHPPPTSSANTITATSSSGNNLVRIGGRSLEVPGAARLTTATTSQEGSGGAAKPASGGFRPIPQRDTKDDSVVQQQQQLQQQVASAFLRKQQSRTSKQLPRAESPPLSESEVRDRKRERNQIKDAKKTTALEELKDLYHFYCEPCQKGFQSEGTYKEHLKLHINCPYEGCNFFCKQDWKLNMHISTLHRHPNAPDLSDTSKYIEQRKGNFPTGDRIKCKIEELYYRAARGELLPKEKVRWLKRQNINIKKPLGPQLKTLAASGGDLSARRGGGGDQIVEDIDGEDDNDSFSDSHEDDEDEEEAGRRRIRLESAVVASVGNAAVLASHHAGISTREQEEMFDRAGPPPPPPPRHSSVDVKKGASIGAEVDNDSPVTESPPPPLRRSPSTPHSVAASEEEMPPAPPMTASTNVAESEDGNTTTSTTNPSTIPTHVSQRQQRVVPPVVPAVVAANNKELGKAVATITASMRNQAARVPAYYVCPKCTKKGDHWAVQCPSTTAAKIASGGIGVVPTTTLPPSPQQPVSAVPVETSARRSAICTNEQDTAEPPTTKAPGGFRAMPPKPAAPVVVAKASRGRGEAPVTSEQLAAHRESFSDAAKAAHDLRSQSKALLKLKPTQQQQKQQQSTPPPTRRQHPTSPHASPPSSNCSSPASTVAVPSLRVPTKQPQLPPPTMNLYDRLVSDERTMDHSLLLQAFRFFVHKEFFGDSELVSGTKRPRPE